MIRFLIAVAALAAPATAQLRVNKPADLAAPVQLAQGQGAIVIGFSRPDGMSAGKSGAVTFGRYDIDKRDLVYQPRDAKKTGDTTTYWVDVRSKDKKQTHEYLVFPVSAGDYVLTGGAPGPGAQIINSFCLGAPTFRVNAGEVVYFGDVTPYIMVKVLGTAPLQSGPAPVGAGSLLFGGMVKSMTAGRTNAMAYSANAEKAKSALASQPALAAAFKAAEIQNGATYGCAAQMMTAYRVPNAPDLPAATTTAQAAN